MSDLVRFTADDNNCRIVTKDDPLVINFTPADFHCLEIKDGGFIQTTTRTTVTIEKLIKA